MSEIAIRAEGLKKTYRVFASPWARLWEAVSGRRSHREFHALADLSFTLPRGEGLGVIGENGAGKSTLLKILAGITAPTSGSLRVEGQVASILELGSGFHPEFTGRQNILLNAAMLGLGRSEVAEKTPAIIEFSELGDFIDQPVKCYSTGMAMRLGFAIATQVEPDVLIIDEALSVGDGYFQKKCMDRLLRFVAEGGTLLFCSHAMYYVSAFCRRAVWLRNGRVEALGPVQEVVERYEEFLLRKSGRDEAGFAGRAPDVPEAGLPGPARILSVDLGRDDGRYRQGEPWRLEVVWKTSDPALAFHLGVGVNRNDGVEILSFATHVDDLEPFRGRSRYRIALEVPELPLVKGTFTLYVFLLDEQGLHVYDREILEGAFTVEPPSYSFGLVAAEHRWNVEAERPMRATVGPITA